MAYAFFAHEATLIPPLFQPDSFFRQRTSFSAIGFRANEHSAGRREGMPYCGLYGFCFPLFGMLPLFW